MAQTTKETIKVSDCHHGAYTSYKIYSKRGANKKTEVAYKCDVCKEWCLVVELLVEEK